MAEETQVQVAKEEIDVSAAAKQAKPKRKSPSPKPEESATEFSADGNPEILLFDKYSYVVEIHDPSLKNYVNLKPIAYPTTYRRGSQKDFSKADINIVERLENTLMRGGTGARLGGHVIRTKGRLQGKKLKVMKIVEEAFTSINKQTGKNPLQILINALEATAPIEDTTRVVYGGITSNVAVDISASRRLDVALRNIAMATILGSFSAKKTIAQALASELTMASNFDVNSYAIKRRNEIERMARSAK
ncbi:MAG TPA: 30S ribosomal protein S7 [Candidatus Baltobacteraceae bacterium]|nr:30S ribosomal protein S7 [Candidatus Baltobacteraceae bacterium]